VDDAFTTINGHTLRYRLSGEGPLAVFGHGLLGSIEQIDREAPVLREFEPRLRLLLYDARGHGQSGGPDDPASYTWESLGLDMTAFLDHTGDEVAIFGGASMGAATALWAALERPERVRALVLVMPPPLGHPQMRGAEEQQALQMLEMLSAAVQNFGLEKTVELARQLPGFSESAGAEERVAWLLEQNPAALRYAIPGLIQSPYHDPEDYRRITAPTIVLAEEGDPLHPARAARLVAERVPGARLTIAPEAGYWRTHPGELIAELSAFLDSLG
jgi:pimeloyl-ACP methyl ester carboxylesterase